MVEGCADAVRRAIVSGALQAGDRLPPERVLAEQFGVNRLTVRAALQSLATAGLLTVRQGSGYRVQDVRRRGGPDLLPEVAQLARDEGDVAEVAGELLRVRRHIARAVLERVVERGIDAAPVVRAIDEFATAVDAGAGVDELARADLDVVAALLDATGSRVLALCLNPVTSVLRELDELRAAMYRAPHTNVAGYRLLARWLAAPDARGVPAIVDELARRDAATVAHLRGRT